MVDKDPSGVSEEIKVEQTTKIVVDSASDATWNAADERPVVDQMVGKTIANYRITSLIGRGAMGSVYRAEHLTLHKQVAIKILHPHLCHDESALKRFRQEATSVSRLHHIGIAQVHDFGVTAEGQPYLSMDYIDGVSLSTVIEDEGPLDPVRALKICAMICDALAEAHRKGVVHRDIKPSNVIVLNRGTPDETIKVVDFGIAKVMEGDPHIGALTQTGESIGSPPYMSPEQCQARPLDPRSDIYSLGCVLYELITDQPVFQAGSTYEMVHFHLTALPDSVSKHNPELPNAEQLDAVVLKALAKDPEKRYRSITDFKRVLLQASARLDAPVKFSDRAKARWDVAVARFDAKKTMVALGIAVLAALPIAAGVYVLHSHNQDASAPGVSVTPSVSNVAEDFSLLKQQAEKYANKKQWPQAVNGYKAAIQAGAPLGLENQDVQDCFQGWADSLEKAGRLAESAEVRKELQHLRLFANDGNSVLQNAAQVLRLTNDYQNNPNDTNVRQRLLAATCQQAQLYAGLGQIKDAEACAQNVLTMTGESNAADLLYRVRALAVMSSTAQQTNHLEQASTYAKAALKLALKAAGPNMDECLFDAYLALASTNTTEAASKALSEKHPESIRLHEAQAKDMYQRAETTAKKVWGERSPMLASLYLDKARLEHIMHDPVASELDSLKAVDLNEEFHGINDPHTARSWASLARAKIWKTYQIKDKTEQDRLMHDAQVLLQKASVIFKQQSTADSDIVALTHSLMARTQAHFGDYAEAEKNWKLALDAAMKTSEKNEVALYAYTNLMELYQKQHRQQDMADLMRKVNPNANEKPAVTDG